MTTKHTPGPWTTYEEADYAGLTIWIDGDFGDGQTGCVCKLEEYSRSLMRANAALIKASPAMYAALKAVLEDVGDLGILSTDVFQAVKDALAEADGNA